MKSRRLFPAVASLVLLAAGMLWLAKRGDDAPGAKAKSPRLTTGEVKDEGKEPRLQAGTNGTAPAPASFPPRERIFNEIEDAAGTYDATALPRITPYLRHPSPEVREAATNGMITLGDAAAGPLLREAARHLTDPREATAMLEAADYVELPPAKLTPRERRQGQPGGGDAISQPR